MSSFLKQRILRRDGAANPAVIIVVVLAVGFALLLCSGILIALLLPAVTSARAAARRAASKINMTEIGLAFHNYADAHGAFPPAYLTDEDGTPMHSWRVLILPYLGQQALYEQYDFDQPWDSPHNRLLLDQMPEVYADPSVESPEPGATAYQALVGPDTVLNGGPGVPFKDVTDGTSSTALAVANTETLVPWTQPADTSVDAFIQAKPFQSSPSGGGLTLFVDGTVKFIKDSTDSAALKAFSTRNGND
ncbi:MAG: DUF1559 domain-containing protein [Blastopirellula sp. JB062]